MLFMLLTDHTQPPLKELNNVMRREAAGVATRWYDFIVELLDSKVSIYVSDK